MNLTIEKMVYGGDGLARRPDGKTVFLPFVLPGEEVGATIVEEKPGFSRATLNELLRTSEARIEAACPYFASCGGCHYQHAGHAAQLRIKSDILRETLRRTAKLAWEKEIVLHSAEPWGYRNRSRMKVRGGNNFALGYHRFSSHTMLPVQQCPISSPAINRMVRLLWEVGTAGEVPEGIHEVEFFTDQADAEVLLEVLVLPPTAGLKEFAESLQARAPEIKGITFFNLPVQDDRSVAAPPRETVGQGFLIYKVGDQPFRVSAGSFFQTNRHLVLDLVKTVVADHFGKTALDLYAGVGLFSNHLVKRFDRVYAVESSPISTADLRANAPKSVVSVEASAEQFLPKCHNLNPELVVADPPRSGLGDRAVKLLAALRAPKIAYLSCDPTTLARDLRVLLEFGYRAEEIHLFDLFPQTFHIESLVRLAR